MYLLYFVNNYNAHAHGLDRVAYQANKPLSRTHLINFLLMMNLQFREIKTLYEIKSLFQQPFVEK